MRLIKFTKILLFIVCTFALMSCASSPEQDELLDYLNDEMSEIAAMESIINLEYGRVSMDNYKDDEIMYASLVEIIIPTSLELIASAEALSIEDESLRDAHKLYLNSVKAQQEAFMIMIKALEEQKYELILKANEKLADSRAIMEEYVTTIMALAKEYDIEFEQ